jgi:flap endonuclease-1
MGVNITDIIPRKEIELSDLKGKTVAIDAYNTLYQFLTTIRQPDGTPLKDRDGNITSHLSGLFYRNINLLLDGIKPVYVFDGKPPELKAKEIERRKEAKMVAESAYEKAKSERNVDDMRKYSARNVHITRDIIEESKALLTAMGIPYIEAPNEGEAEAAVLARSGKVWASVSQDYDSILYGTPFLIRNLTLSRRRKTSTGLYVDVKPELIELQDVLNHLNISLDQLICLAILVGTDYNPGGVKGLGQKRALELVQRHEYPAEIFKSIESNDKYNLIFDWQEIFKLFHEYESNSHEEIKFNDVDETALTELLLKHGFSQNRIDSGLEKLGKYKEDKKQKSLGEFF